MPSEKPNEPILTRAEVEGRNPCREYPCSHCEREQKCLNTITQAVELLREYYSECQCMSDVHRCSICDGASAFLARYDGEKS